MRLYRVLLTPWVATPRSTRWIRVLLLALALLGDALLHLYAVAPRPRVFNAVALGIANAACWLLLLPNGLLLALAARRLRVPRISREVVWSLLLYAALGIGVPMLCQFPQGHVLSFAIAQVLVAVGAMLLMVLPCNLVLALYLLFMISHRAVNRLISVLGLSDPHFVSLAVRWPPCYWRSSRGAGTSCCVVVVRNEGRAHLV